jgi:hypothetical protein
LKGSFRHGGIRSPGIRLTGLEYPLAFGAGDEALVAIQTAEMSDIFTAFRREDDTKRNLFVADTALNYRCVADIHDLLLIMCEGRAHRFARHDYAALHAAMPSFHAATKISWIAKGRATIFSATLG